MYGGAKWKQEMEETLKILIDETLKLRKMWEQRRLEADNQIKSLDAKLTAYQVALKDYWEHMDMPDKLKQI
jgi:hypothetical protein